MHLRAVPGRGTQPNAWGPRFQKIVENSSALAKAHVRTSLSARPRAVEAHWRGSDTLEYPHAPLPEARHVRPRRLGVAWRASGPLGRSWPAGDGRQCPAPPRDSHSPRRVGRRIGLMRSSSSSGSRRITPVRGQEVPKPNPGPGRGGASRSSPRAVETSPTLMQTRGEHQHKPPFPFTPGMELAPGRGRGLGDKTLEGLPDRRSGLRRGRGGWRSSPVLPDQGPAQENTTH